MRPELTEAIRRSIGSWDTASTLPTACYTDHEVYRLEQERLFHQGWVGVGRHDRWPNPGDYTELDIAGAPIIIARSDDSTLHAMANTCSHRSAQIVTGAGNRKRLRCPFHAWTYDLDGRLLAAPSMNHTPGFDQQMPDLCLTSYPVAERHGFVFVSLDPTPTPIDEWLGDFTSIHQPWPLADLATARRREFTVDCNWKAFAEVFNEYYHLPYVHATSIDDLYHDPDPADETTGHFATQFGLTDGTGAVLASDAQHALPLMPGLTGRPAGGVRYTWLFPNIVVALGIDSMWMYEVYPDGPERCLCAQTVAFPPSSFTIDGYADKATAYFERADIAIGEDIPVLEQQLRGQRSPHTKQGRYSHLEPSIARFGSWYAQRLLA